MLPHLQGGTCSPGEPQLSQVSEEGPSEKVGGLFFLGTLLQSLIANQPSLVRAPQHGSPSMEKALQSWP